MNLTFITLFITDDFVILKTGTHTYIYIYRETKRLKSQSNILTKL